MNVSRPLHDLRGHWDTLLDSYHVTQQHSCWNYAVLMMLIFCSCVVLVRCPCLPQKSSVPILEAIAQFASSDEYVQNTADLAQKIVFCALTVVDMVFAFSWRLTNSNPFMEHSCNVIVCPTKRCCKMCENENCKEIVLQSVSCAHLLAFFSTNLVQTYALLSICQS